MTLRQTGYIAEQNRRVLLSAATHRTHINLMNGDVEKTRQDDEAFLTVVVFPL